MNEPIRYAPAFDVKIAGVSLAADVTRQTLRVSCESGIDVADMFTLVLNNEGNQMSDSPLFAPGKSVEVHMGYGTTLTPIMLGEIAALQASFPENGPTTVTVSGYDLSTRLRRAEPDRPSFEYVPDHVIVTQLALQSGLIPIVEPAPRPPRAKLNSVGTDWQLLQQLASDNFFDLRVEWDRLHFQFPRPQTEAIVLQWGANLSSFSPRFSNARAEAFRIVRAYDARLAQEIVGLAATLDGDVSSLIERLGSAARDMLSGLGRRVLRNVRISSQFDALAVARALIQEMLEGMYEASGSCIGLPTLTAGNTVQIRGVGKRFSGAYRVSKVTHTLDDSGFRTSFEINQKGAGTLAQLLQRDDDTAPGKPAAPTRRKSGVAYGRVTRNDDPEGRARVQVTMPGFSEFYESAWADTIAPMAADDAGISFLPDVGDQVVLGFEDGDMERPVVLGSVWHGTSRPPTNNLDGRNTKRAIRTKAGHEITFDDSDGNETLSIVDSGGSKVTMSKSGLQLSTGQDLSLHADGDLKLSAKNVQIDASEQLALEAGEDIKLSAVNVEIMLANATGAVSIDVGQ